MRIYKTIIFDQFKLNSDIFYYSNIYYITKPTDKIKMQVPKKSFFLVAVSNKEASGKPFTSMIHCNCSFSFSPGKRGHPTKSN